MFSEAPYGPPGDAELSPAPSLSTMQRGCCQGRPRPDDLDGVRSSRLPIRRTSQWLSPLATE